MGKSRLVRMARRRKDGMEKFQQLQKELHKGIADMHDVHQGQLTTRMQHFYAWEEARKLIETQPLRPRETFLMGIRGYIATQVARIRTQDWIDPIQAAELHFLLMILDCAKSGDWEPMNALRANIWDRSVTIADEEAAADREFEALKSEGGILE